jgi:hypothetical protein
MFANTHHQPATKQHNTTQHNTSLGWIMEHGGIMISESLLWKLIILNHFKNQNPTTTILADSTLNYIIFRNVENFRIFFSPNKN